MATYCAEAIHGRAVMAAKNRIRVAILFGGRSAEHEVSLQSARNVVAALDRERYEPLLIGIDRDGGWHLNEKSLELLDADDPRAISLHPGQRPVALLAGRDTGLLVDRADAAAVAAVDVLFPVLHGPYGEDGSVQGLARLANLACVGSGILGSAVGMDKDVGKRLLRDAGIAVAQHLCLRRRDLHPGLAREVETLLGYPVFVKPANMGSSVGVVRVDHDGALAAALDTALKYDNKILVEECIDGREIECAVLGNDEPEASTIGEIVTADGFYSYTRKYLDADGAILKIPAELDAATLEAARATAIAAFRTLEARGMARVDMFLTADGRIHVNEINTIPGFTAISMYPKLWQASGLSYGELIDRLIRLALEEHAASSSILTSGY